MAPLEPRMFFRQVKAVVRASRELFADSGFAMAGAVAFAFVLSLFPFCIFLTAVAAHVGGEKLARDAVEFLFQLAPAPVAEPAASRVATSMFASSFAWAITSCSSLESMPVAERPKVGRSSSWDLLEAMFGTSGGSGG